MSTYSQFFSTNPGRLTENPKYMTWFVGNEAYLSCDDATVTNQVSTYSGDDLITGADVWTYLAAWGDVSQVGDDDTYATITNVASGSGIVTHLVLPGVTNVSDTVSVQLTVDGVAYAYTFTAANATDRFFSGLAFERGSVIYSSAGYGQGVAPYPLDWSTGGFVSGIASRLSASYKSFIVPPNGVLQSGVPLLRFTSSLKVEMKSSNYTTTNNRDDCAVVYLLDQ